MRVLLNMSLMASIVVLVVVLVRQVFAWLGVPKRYAYLLWILPFIRLVCPWSVESGLSLLPDTGQVVSYAVNAFDNKAQEERDTQHTGETGVSHPRYDDSRDGMTDAKNDGTLNEYEPDSDIGAWNQGNAAFDRDMSDKNTEGSTQNKRAGVSGPWENDVFWWILTGVWISGVLGVLLHGIAGYRKLKERLTVSFLVRDNIYLVDDIEAAFVAGYLTPCIYLPSGIQEKEMEYIIAHEQVHIARRDYLVKTLAFAVAALHWFNPVCWLAFALMGKDMEMSCDETVTGGMDAEEKRTYANVLLDMATGKRQLAGVRLTFAEGNPKERIRNILKNKKPVMLASVLAVVVIVLLSVTLLTNPETNAKPDGADPDKALQGTAEDGQNGLGSETGGKTMDPISEEIKDPSDEGISMPYDVSNGNPANPYTLVYEGCLKPDDLPYGEIQITAPLVTDWGADYVELIYASPAYAVGWGHMGLFVYSVKDKKLTGAVNVEVIGCDKTQGDEYTDVFVADEARVVYMHPTNKDYMFAYNIFENTLEKQEFVDGGNGRPKGFKVNDNRVNTYKVLNGQTPDVWMSAMCEIFTVNVDQPDEKKYLGYLASGSGVIGDLSYVIVEWNEAENAWDSRDGAIWCPYIENWYSFFEGEEQNLLWEFTEDSCMYFAKAAGISKKGLTLGIYNCSPKEVLYGEEFHLYRYAGDGSLEELKYIQDIGFHEIAYPLAPKDPITITIDWTWVYGELPTDKGEIQYRLVKKLSVPRSDGNDGADGDAGYDEVELGVDFTFPSS